MIARAGGSMFSVCLQVDPGHSCQRNISRMLLGVFFKPCTNVYSASRLNWLDFSGPRSKVTATSHFFNVTSQECLQGNSSTLVHLNSRMNWLHFEVRGQSHYDLKFCDDNIALRIFFKFGTNLDLGLKGYLTRLWGSKVTATLHTVRSQ